MRQRLRCFGAIILAGVIILPALADDKGKDAPTPEKPTPEKPAPSAKAPPEKWLTVWDTIGTLSKVNGTSIALKVEDQAATQQQRLQQLIRSKGKGGGGGAAKAKTKDVDLVLAEDVKVRVGAPPIEFDDKGDLKKYSSEELKNLKGGERTWGFAADTSQLNPGDVVRVIVARKKTSGPRPKDTIPEEPVVKMIFILKDAAEKAGGDKAKKK